MTVDGGPALKASSQVHGGQAVALVAPPRAYVSRGGEKLAHALSRFHVEVTGRRCLDAGVSTGGFTDCLLQNGAAEVVAYDVGYGQVHERLRTDPRVRVNERTNIRDVTPEDVGAPLPELIVCDVSFIALKTVLPVLRSLGDPMAEAVLLVKPQFEAERGEVGKGGVVRDPEVWRRVITEVVEVAAELGWTGADVTASPLQGPAGNIEFLAHLTTGARPPDLGARIDGAVAEGLAVRSGELDDGGA